jgi:UDP-sugar transporter A1/2/3
MRIVVLVVLCLQNSLFTVLRRYSQGVLKENYSKYEVLLVGEVIKMAFSAYMIKGTLDENVTLTKRLQFLVQSSRKMIVLALIYGAMNILSFVSLRNIGAGMFTIFAQCKILTTASFSALMLNRKYSWTQWRAMIALMLGVLLFSEPIWGKSGNLLSTNAGANVIVGTVAVLIEVILSGFASIYFEKVIKIDPQQLSIWERNFQLALGSFPVYLCFIATDSPAEGFGSGWSIMAVVVTSLGAGGGLLVALSIKYGDSILKTLATTGAIILSSVLDNLFLGGPLTPTMMIAGLQVIVAICNYTFDSTPTEMKLVKPIATRAQGTETSGKEFDEEQALIREEK